MAEVLFYHLTLSTLEEALPPLLERTLQRGWRAVVQTGSDERRGALDAHLWVYRDESFLAHGNDGEPHAEAQPILLTTGDGNRNGAQVRVAGLRFAIATDLVNAFSVGNGVHLRTGKLEFGAVGANADHIFADNPCHIAIEEDYAITGGARRHMNIGAGYVSGANRTLTLTGTPAFTQFLAASNCASIALSNLTISGGATGSRYIAETNGVINTFGKATTYLPGSTAGTTPTGGIYA